MVCSLLRNQSLTVGIDTTRTNQNSTNLSPTYCVDVIDHRFEVFCTVLVLVFPLNPPLKPPKVHLIISISDHLLYIYSLRKANQALLLFAGLKAEQMTLLMQIYYGCSDIYGFHRDSRIISMEVNHVHKTNGIKCHIKVFIPIWAGSGDF